MSSEEQSDEGNVNMKEYRDENGQSIEKMVQLSNMLMVAKFGIGMDNVIEKMVQLTNMLMVPKIGIGMANVIEKMVQLSNMLMVPNYGITMIKELIVNPTKSF